MNYITGAAPAETFPEILASKTVAFKQRPVLLHLLDVFEFTAFFLYEETDAYHVVTVREFFV